ncbi:MAG TPA: hypothetical protein VHK67_06900 [Rhabdochlamydiaceae bacterium]|jgi:type II secretory pathway pseudopilin PulG|nr:hypothetical protein [Rhabdochlamydiaceae bacterium]
MKRCTRPLSLLEIVIVIALIGMMAAWGTWSLSDLLAQQRRQAEIDELYTFIQELQIEALALQSDLELIFTQDRNRLCVSSKTPEKILRNKTVVLKGIKELKFHNQIKSKFALQILSTGRIIPTGLIEIQKDKGSLWIDLRQPLLVKFFDKQPPLIPELIPDKPKKKDGGLHATHKPGF